VNEAERTLLGRTIGITADRRWQEQAALFTKRGAEVCHGPTMRTVEVTDDPVLRGATEDLIERPADYVVATTGMGMRLWLSAAERWGLDGELLRSFSQSKVIARGAKSASALRAAGLNVWWQAPEERMEDIVHRLEAEDTSTARIALQLFDPAEHPSTGQLRSLAGALVEVPVYRWLLPEDRAPATELIGRTLAGTLDAVTFTSQPAVYNLFRIAAAQGQADELRGAFNRDVLAACVGPVCAEAASEEGIASPLWPDPPRLPALVRLVEDRLRA
jgi:uroporphyrinogen-III synthase